MPKPGPRGQLGRLWSAEFLALGVGVVQGLVLARTLGPAPYGVYALAVTFAALVYLVLDPRSGDALVRYLVDFRRTDDIARQRALVKALLLVDGCLGLVGVGLIALTAGVASRALHIEGRSELLVVAAVGAASAAPIFSSRAVLSVFERFDLISRRQIAAALVRVAAVMWIAVVTPGVGFVILLVSFVSVAEMLLFVGTALHVSRRVLGASVITASLSSLHGRRREIASFMVGNGGSTLLTSSIKQVDTLVVGAVAGPREAGLYRLAKSLTIPVGTAAVPVQTMLYPSLAGAWSRGDREGFRVLAQRAFRRTGLPLALLTLCTLPLVGSVIRSAAGADFDGAVLPAQGLLVGAAIALASIHQRPMFLSGGWTRPLLVFTAVISVVSVAAFVPAAWTWGADGVAWIRTLLVVLATIGMATFLRRASRPV